MSSVIVECWNCGQKLNIRADKLSTARCGNCQQMVAKQDQPKATYTSTNGKERPNLFALIFSASMKSQFPLILIFFYIDEIVEWMGNPKAATTSTDAKLHQFFIFLACVSAVVFVVLILRGLQKRR